MRTLILFSLALCAVPALAQPDTMEAAPPVVERPAPPRPADVAEQIKLDLKALTGGALQNNGFFLAYPYVYGARIGYFGASEWAGEVRRLLQYGTVQIESVRVLQRDGKSARAEVKYKIVPTRNDDALNEFWGKTHQETVDLKLEAKPLDPNNSVWKIVPPQTAPPALETSDSIAKQDALLANIAYHLAQKQLPEPIGTPAERSVRNLKQLGLGVLQFTQDYDEIYAFAPRYLIEAISPYIASPAIFQVPDTNEIYTFNGNLSGKNLAVINEVFQTVLFYEGQNETPIFRYDGKAAICFADGHVALVSPDEAQKLIWKP